MNRAVIVFSSMLIATASFSAFAQAPDWFAVKHPEIRTMEHLRTGQPSGRAESRQLLAAHQTAVRTFGNDWYAVKHPEIRMMEQMRAKEAHEHVNFAMHSAGGHPPGHDAGSGVHGS
jgi:hypothetical protein